MRKRMLVPLALAAILLAACEIRTDYDLAIADDSSATLAFDMFYDMEAAELLGPAEEFLEEEIQGDVGIEEDGVTLVSAEAGTSDGGYRISAVFAAVDGEAFDGLVDEMFPGSSFTSDDGTTWTLTLRPDEDVADDFGDDLDLGEFGLDFISGEVRIEHAGTQVSMSGGTSEGGNLIVWDPYGPASLEVVMDLSGATPPSGGAEAPAEEVEEPEEPEVEAPVEEEVEATEDDADAGAGADAEDTSADVEEAAGDSSEELDAVAAADEGGLSTALLAGIIGALLFLIIVVGTLMLVKRRGKGKEAAAGQPVAAAAGAYGQGGWDQTQPPQQGDGTRPSSSRRSRVGGTRPSSQQQPPQHGSREQPPPQQGGWDQQPPQQGGWDQTQQRRRSRGLGSDPAAAAEPDPPQPPQQGCPRSRVVGQPAAAAGWLGSDPAAAPAAAAAAGWLGSDPAADAAAGLAAAAFQ
jgi:hypothetical protein